MYPFSSSQMDHVDITRRRSEIDFVQKVRRRSSAAAQKMAVKKDRVAFCWAAICLWNLAFSLDCTSIATALPVSTASCSLLITRLTTSPDHRPRSLCQQQPSLLGRNLVSSLQCRVSARLHLSRTSSRPQMRRLGLSTPLRCWRMCLRLGQHRRNHACWPLHPGGRRRRTLRLDLRLDG